MEISIVIPCRNEKAFIRECVEAVIGSAGLENIQKKIFIVDGMSDDGTRDIIRELCAAFPEVQLVDNTRQLTPYAFNLGIKAGGSPDYVQIIGARHIISEKYLASCLEILQKDPSVWCVGGKIINSFVNKTGEIISKAMSTSFGMGLGNFRTLDQSGFTDTVTSPMYPYHVFEKIGFFDEELIRNQDDDFNFRVTKAGGKIYYENSISLKYYVRATFQGAWRQFYQYGYWKVYVNKKHQAITTFRQLIPPLFVLYLLLVVLCSLFPPLLIWTSIPLLLYFVLANVVSYRLQHTFRWRSFLLTCLTFPILHISYGLGYLKGIFHFVIFRQKPSEKQKRLSR